MNKEYIAPAIEIIDIEVEDSLCASKDFNMYTDDYDGEWDE